MSHTARTRSAHIAKAAPAGVDWRGFVAFAKVDEAAQIVEGVISGPLVDTQGEIVDPDAMQKALPAYMEWANVREMHTDSAVGTALKTWTDVATGLTHIVAHIVDPLAWQKVVARVYKGFSIGGKVINSVLEKGADGHQVRRITALDLIEVSVVDRPAYPGAKILVWKAETTPMQENDGAVTTAEETNPEGEAPSEALPTGQPLPGAPIARSVSVDMGAAEAANLTAIIKAAGGDPMKIVALIQQLRNDAETDGDTDAAASYSTAINAILAATGKADDNDDDGMTDAAGNNTNDTGADPNAVTAAAEPETTKAGRAISSANASHLRQAHDHIASAMGLDCAPGGAPGSAIDADADPQTDDVMMAAQAATTKGVAAEIGAALAPAFDAIAKALTPLATPTAELKAAVDTITARVAKFERQPAPGGPVLRAVDRAVPGAGPVAKAADPIEAELATLDRLIAKATSANVIEELRQQKAELRFKQAMRG